MDNNQPAVYTTNEGKIINKPWYKTWRIIYAILVVVIVVELIFGIKSLLTPVPKASNKATTSAKTLQVSKAKILLLSAKLNVKVGDIVPVSIQVDTGGYATAGTDVVFRFNPNLLEASPSSFIRGKIYSDYPLVSIDSKTGTVRISGVAASKKQAFNGNGVLGLLNFKAKAPGVNTFKIDFTKGETHDSNIIASSTNQNILEGVNNLKITIK